MLEARQRGEIARRVREHDGLRARLLREWHEQRAALFIRRVFAPFEPDHRVLHRLPLFIQHRDDIARRPGALEQRPLAFAHQRAARLPAADELDDPRPALPRQLGKLERPHATPERTAPRGVGGEIVRDLAVRHEAVEREVGVELALAGEEIRERVELVDFHDELRRVLDEKVERHVVGGRGEGRIGQREIHIHAVL